MKLLLHPPLKLLRRLSLRMWTARWMHLRLLVKKRLLLLLKVWMRRRLHLLPKLLRPPVPQDIDSEVDAPAPVGEEAATPAPQDVGGKADAPVPASENASAPATQSADGKVAEPTSAGGATPASGVTAPAPAPAQNSTTNTVNAPVQGAAPVSGGTVPGTANAPKTANVPGMAANNMPASTART